MNKHNQIDYVELPAADMAATQEFFHQVFGWEFTHWGEEYMDSASGGIAIGFYHTTLNGTYDTGGALVTIYRDDLEQALEEVEQHGGQLTKEIFSFPGGRRFQFLEPSGNEFAVWSDK